MGVERAGFKTTAIIEKDKWACQTLQQNKSFFTATNSNSLEIFHGNIEEFDFSTLTKNVQLVSGGPPCQPFSLGGKHKANSDNRDLFPQAIRAVRELRPQAFIFENVKGLTRSTFSNYFEYIRLQLTFPDIVQKSGEEWFEHLCRLELHQKQSSYDNHSYQVKTQVLNAANYGVPQKRERVFFVGFRSDLNISWSFPSQTHSKYRLILDQTKNGGYWDRHKVPKEQRIYTELSKNNLTNLEKEIDLLPWSTVRDALADLPPPYSRSIKRNVKSNRVTAHFAQPGAKAYKGHTGSPLDEPAKTLKAGVHGVPGGENMLRFHDGQVRYFTVRECARLQTFPDDFEFHGSWTETMRQLGNAVPTELARVIAHSILKKLHILN